MTPDSPNAKKDPLVLVRGVSESIWDIKRSIYLSTGTGQMGSELPTNSGNRRLRQSLGSHNLNPLRWKYLLITKTSPTSAAPNHSLVIKRTGPSSCHNSTLWYILGQGDWGLSQMPSPDGGMFTTRREQWRNSISDHCSHLASCPWDKEVNH